MNTFLMSLDKGDSVYEYLDEKGLLAPSMGKTFTSVQLIDEENLKDTVTKFTHSFCTFKNNVRKNDNVIEMSCYVIDFDDLTTIEIFLKSEVAEKFNYILYTSRHHQMTYTKKGKLQNAKDRFHVAIPISYSNVEDAKNNYLKFQNMLFFCGLNPDTQVKDPARLLYPSRVSGKEPDENFRFIKQTDKAVLTMQDIEDYDLKYTQKLQQSQSTEVQQQNNKKLKKIKTTAYEQTGDTRANVEGAIEVLCQQEISEEIYYKCGLALANTYGENGRQLFLKFATNPFYNDNEMMVSKKYDYFLSMNSEVSLVRGKLGVGSIVHYAKMYGFMPVYAENDMNTADKIAELLNINPIFLKSSNPNEIKFFTSNGVTAQVTKYMNGVANKPTILATAPVGDSKMLMLSEFFGVPANDLQVEYHFGINKTSLYNQIIARKGYCDDDIYKAIDEVKETKYLNDTFDPRDSSRIPSCEGGSFLLHKHFETPVLDLSLEHEKHFDNCNKFEEIINYMYGDCGIDIKVLFKYFTQTFLEHRENNGQAEPIILLQGNRGGGKSMFFDLINLWFGSKGMVIKDNFDPNFNDFLLNPVIFFDESEKNRLQLATLLKAVTGTKTMQINSKNITAKSRNISPKIIIAANKRPIAISEPAKNDSNNAYIYLNLDLSPIDPQTKIDTVMKKYVAAGSNISQTLFEFAKSWAWIKGVKIFDEICEERTKTHYRYGFSIPVTNEMKTLEADSISQRIEKAMEALMRAYKQTPTDFQKNKDAIILFQSLLTKKEPFICISNMIDVLSETSSKDVRKADIIEFFKKHNYIPENLSTARNKTEVYKGYKFNFIKFMSEYSDITADDEEEITVTKNDKKEDDKLPF